MRNLVTVPVLLLVAGCQAPPPEMSGAVRDAVVAEVEDYLVELEAAYEALDVDRAMSLFVQTPEYVWATRGGFVRGFEAIEEYDRAFFSSLESLVWTPTDKHISVLSRDAVAVLDRGTTVQTDLEGVSSESAYTFTFVLVRLDGEWKMLLGHGAFVEE